MTEKYIFEREGDNVYYRDFGAPANSRQLVTNFSKQLEFEFMKDDGDGVDRVANDGVYSLEIFPRSSLPNGEIEIFVRGTDIYLSTTDVNDQNLILKLDKIEQSTADNWISENQSLLIVIGLSFVLLLAFAGILMVLRNSKID